MAASVMPRSAACSVGDSMSSALAEQFADARDDLAAVQFDVGHELVVGQARHAVLQVEPDRLIAYGRARIEFLIGHRDIACAALDGRERVPAGSQTPMSREHIRFLLGEMSLGAADLDILATQLTAALDGPLLLYLSSAILTQAAPQVSERLGRGWEDLTMKQAVHEASHHMAVAYGIST